MCGMCPAHVVGPCCPDVPIHLMSGVRSVQLAAVARACSRGLHVRQARMECAFECVEFINCENLMP